MKQCPQCRQTYPDDTLFCLSDGTPLVFINAAPEAATVFQPTQPTQEEITVVKPHREEITVVRPTESIQPPAQPAKQGSSPFFAYLAIGLLLLLVGGVAVLAGIFIVSRMSGGNTNIETAKATNTDNGQNKISEEQANLRQQQEQIEKERQRLANERQKLNEEKNKPRPPVNASTPMPTPTPVSTPPPAPTNYPAQPTARIKFGRGRVSESISGKIYTQRSFVLEARSGQFLSASVNGGGCVTFSGGGTNAGFATANGDNRLTLVNNCGREAGFTLTVSIR